MSSSKGETYEWKIRDKGRLKAAGQPEDSEESTPAKQPALRLAVLLSGSGSNLQALIDATESHELPGLEIVLVVSNNIDAYGLERAHKHHLQTMYLPWQDRRESETSLTTWLQLYQVDLVVLAGWMRILSASFLAQFPRRVINIHPALMPDDGTGNAYITGDGTTIPVFRGMHAVRQALDARVKVTGSSVHFVTPEVDAGPVICREEVAILENDTEESLHERLKVVEHRLIVQVVRKLMSRSQPLL
ncbi:MAG TPA: phosphoribosylglycinamide formyltransferase [Ktedonobacteraceae bacterium]|nr:phosphoribosylglycinamide formyltransferase [Ktedonobacteraceae bacterium]